MPSSNQTSLYIAILALLLAGFATYCGKYNYDAGRKLTEWTQEEHQYDLHSVKDTCHGQAGGCAPGDHIPPPPPPPKW
jgi:hypothetical protein